MSRPRKRDQKKRGKTKTPRRTAGDEGGWVTLRNHRRVELDDEGRLRRGLVPELHGVHIQDLSEVSRRLRKTRKRAVACKETARHQHERAGRDQERAPRKVAGRPGRESAPARSAHFEPEAPQAPAQFEVWTRPRDRAAKQPREPRRSQLDLFGQQQEPGAGESRALVRRGDVFYLPPEEAEVISPADELALLQMEDERCDLNAAEEADRILYQARTGRVRTRRPRKKRRS